MIWCVEDDASIRDIEVYALQSTGFEAKGFEDGTSFWEALRTGRPELVVLDVMLPGIDGMELLRRMRADAALSDIPVVMATAKVLDCEEKDKLKTNKRRKKKKKTKKRKKKEKKIKKRKKTKKKEKTKEETKEKEK